MSNTGIKHREYWVSDDESVVGDYTFSVVSDFSQLTPEAQKTWIHVIEYDAYKELELKLALAYDSCQKHAAVVDKLMEMRPNLVRPIIKEVWGE